MQGAVVFRKADPGKQFFDIEAEKFVFVRLFHDEFRFFYFDDRVIGRWPGSFCGGFGVFFKDGGVRISVGVGVQVDGGAFQQDAFDPKFTGEEAYDVQGGEDPVSFEQVVFMIFPEAVVDVHVFEGDRHPREGMEEAGADVSDHDFTVQLLGRCGLNVGKEGRLMCFYIDPPSQGDDHEQYEDACQEAQGIFPQFFQSNDLGSGGQRQKADLSKIRKDQKSGHRPLDIGAVIGHDHFIFLRHEG